MKKRICGVVLCILLVTLTACQKESAPEKTPITDPSGASVTVPETIESIVVLAPSLTETVVALGLADKIAGYDLNSAGIEGLPKDVPTFDTVTPDVEKLLVMAPDVLLVSSLSLYDQESPYQPLIDAGVCVICVPTSESIEGVKSDISFLAEALHAKEAGEKLLTDLNAELDRLAAIAKTIPEEERKTVYFEISAAPYMYSCGSGTYLNEMIEWIGGKNVLAAETGWLPVEAETIVAADPDVILTNVNYIEEPAKEILGREGWRRMNAIRHKDVYYIDNQSSSLPNQNIVKAMGQMAKAVYPDYYEDAA